jgi:cobalt-zinc-cadmium efflux system membrane fusion protein
VLLSLGGIAAWGHYSDWQLPKFSALIGGSAPDAQQWCDEHNVPEVDCIECNVALLPPGKEFGWCKVHGVAECPLEHPEVAQLKQPPEASAADKARAERALKVMPRAENSSRCTLHHHRIQFASAAAADKAGVDIAIVQRQPIVEAVTANGEIVYDQTRAAHLSPRVPGTVWRVERTVGEAVRKGDLLALVEAAEVGRAKGEFLQALAQSRLKAKNAERIKPLSASGSVPERAWREAETALQESQIRLMSAQQTLVNLGMPAEWQAWKDLSTEEIAQRIQFLGLPREIVEPLDPAATTSNLIGIKSPLDGVVVERNAVAGEVVDNARTLFVVADTSRMWLTLDVRQEDTRLLSLGQKVRFCESGSSECEEVLGQVVWISTAADAHTRTVKIRADLPNSEGRLRANTFGTGRIVLRDEPEAIVVPSDAVHWEGCCNVVFVRDKNYLDPASPKFYRIRKVRLGVKEGGVTEIIAGLAQGEVIADKGSNVLAAQLLKSKLGEGCSCAHGH